MESEIMSQMWGARISHLDTLAAQTAQTSSPCGYCGPRKGGEALVEDKTIPEVKPRWSFLASVSLCLNEGSILSFVLQLMPSLQTFCFVHRLLNCKSQYKISLSVDKEGYICTAFCPRQNSKLPNRIYCPSLIFNWSNTFNKSATSTNILMMNIPI